MRHLYYTIRILLRGRGNNIIKLVSLTLGLLIGVLLFSQIAYELNYENFYKEPDNVVLLRNRYIKNNIPDNGYDYTVFYPAAADLWEALPELVESATAGLNFFQPELYIGDKKLEDVAIMYVDTLFFHTLGLEVLKGNPRELGQPGSAFLSASKARELFGDEDPLGKTFSILRNKEITVRGIYQDIPGNTVFPHNIAISMLTLEELGFGRGTWGRNDMYYIFFRLKHPGDVKVMNGQIQKAVEKYKSTRQGSDTTVEYNVIPLPDIHLSMPGSIRLLVILGTLGFSIFFVSVMNYVLAAVASLGHRAKAVGIHKCCGANDARVLEMFLWETALFVFTSALLCLLLMYNFREGIEDLLSVRLPDLFVWQNLWVPGLTVLLLFFVAGVLPGRMFAHIPVTQIFRRYADAKRTWKRRLLFVQFVGVSFIFGMLLTTIWQYHDLTTRHLGFDTERLVTGKYRTEDLQGIEDAIRRQPYVESVVRSSESLLSHYGTTRLLDTKGNFICPLHFQRYSKGFPQAVGMKLVEGNWPSHKGEAVIGRKVVEIMKWEDKALGQRLPVEPGWVGLDSQPTVVGVIEDIRNMGFFLGQTCTAFIYNDQHNFAYNVRLKEPMDENLIRLNTFIKETYPMSTLEFTSYSTIQSMNYKDVYRFRNVVWITSCCILFIVLMGLIGYVNNETVRRSKEIAIRKVNGAAAFSILYLLTIDILKVAVGAVVIGIAFSWYVSGVWLEQFADSKLLSPLWFIALGIGVLLLIILCVVLRAWHIANENPVNSIKNE